MKYVWNILPLSLALAIAAPLTIAQTTTVQAQAAQIASARDKVLPYVVSILVVREDFSQGEPTLSVSSGSGTVITPQGHVATNAHVTDNGKSFRVVFGDGRELQAKLVGEDPASDLAVLKLQPEKAETFVHADFAKTLDLTPGDTVLAMGAPWGLSNSMSAGVVNNPRRLLVSLFDDESDYEDSLNEDATTGRYYAWIQHDAAIAPGNSGGPLVDLKGRIVGVNTRGMIFGGDLAFAIPSPDVARVVAELIDKGKVERSYLGFRMRSLKGTDFKEGVLVTAVERDSPAQKAGLMAGDRILQINGQPVSAAQPVDVPGLQRQLAELKTGAPVAMSIIRGSATQTLRLTAQAQPEPRGTELAFAPFGVSLTALTSSMIKRRNLEIDSGLLVTGVRPGGPATTARPELPSGAVIRRIAGTSVSQIEDLAAWEKSTKNKTLVIEYMHQGERKLSLLTPSYGDVRNDPLPELPKAWSGVEVQPITDSLASAMDLGKTGYRVTRLFPGSPLGAAGIKVGDLITSIDEQALRASNDSRSEPFHQRVRDLEVGKKATFAVIRDGKTQNFTAELTPSPATAAGLRTVNVRKLRVQLRELGFYDRVSRRLPTKQAGVLVEGVEAGGPAGLAHLDAGDVVVRIGTQKVADLDSFSRALESALDGSERLIPLEVLRGSETRILYLEKFWLSESL